MGIYLSKSNGTKLEAVNAQQNPPLRKVCNFEPKKLLFKIIVQRGKIVFQK